MHRHCHHIARRALALAVRPAPLVVALLLAACGSETAPTAPVEPPPPVQPATPPVYQVAPPAGKLPWPHHDPAWDQVRYAAMLDSLWVVNNFGVYQGSGDAGTLYLHSGLDVVLPNGTPIYAVEAGTVRANIGGSEFYRTLLVEDEDEPGYGWGYTHVYGFRVLPGQRVEQGTLLASVNFQGLEHIHLTRFRLAAGASWGSFEGLIDLQPDTFFVYRDTEAPIFEGPFRYRSGSGFAMRQGDAPVELSGDVEIVVGLRDPGEWSRSKRPFGGAPSYGDRNMPNRVDLEIADAGGVVLTSTAFDMSKLEIPQVPTTQRSAQVQSIFHHYESVQPPGPPPGNFNQKFNFYVATAQVGVSPRTQILPVERGAWRTAELAADGTRRFPDGSYRVTIRARDFKGNLAERTEDVVVRN